MQTTYAYLAWIGFAVMLIYRHYLWRQLGQPLRASEPIGRRWPIYLGRLMIGPIYLPLIAALLVIDARSGRPPKPSKLRVAFIVLSGLGWQLAHADRAAAIATRAPVPSADPVRSVQPGPAFHTPSNDAAQLDTSVSAGAILVPVRNQPLQIAGLAIQCDARELPAALDGAEQFAYWVGECTFRGHAIAPDGGVTEMFLREPGAIGVGQQRVVGIIGPRSANRPALWWSWSLGSFTVQAQGAQGIVHARPDAVVLQRTQSNGSGEGSISLKMVARLDPTSRQLSRMNEENSLIAALRGPQRSA